MHTIEIGQLMLRPPRVEDFEQYAALYAEAEQTTFGFMTLSREDAWSRLLRFVGHWSVFGYGLFVAEERPSGRIVGEMGVAYFQRTVDPSCEGLPEAGWRVAQSMRGRGVATEGMQAILSWFDSQIEAPRTFCLIHPDNVRSQRVASRLGYRELSRGQFRAAPIISLIRDRSQ
ncbi:MAG: GNAT family N-acetyltransferase [Steroidobacter sp.]